MWDSEDWFMAFTVCAVALLPVAGIAYTIYLNVTGF